MEYLFIYLGLNVLVILFYKLTGEYDDMIDNLVDQCLTQLPQFYKNRNHTALVVIIGFYLLAFPDFVYHIVNDYILKR